MRWHETPAVASPGFQQLQPHSYEPERVAFVRAAVHEMKKQHAESCKLIDL